MDALTDASNADLIAKLRAHVAQGVDRDLPVYVNMLCLQAADALAAADARWAAMEEMLPTLRVFADEDAAAIAQARKDAIEECAQIADRCLEYPRGSANSSVAAAIRALITKETPK